MGGIPSLGPYISELAAVSSAPLVHLPPDSPPGDGGVCGRGGGARRRGGGGGAAGGGKAACGAEPQGACARRRPAQQRQRPAAQRHGRQRRRWNCGREQPPQRRGRRAPEVILAAELERSSTHNSDVQSDCLPNPPPFTSLERVWFPAPGNQQSCTHRDGLNCRHLLCALDVSFATRLGPARAAHVFRTTVSTPVQASQPYSPGHLLLRCRGTRPFALLWASRTCPLHAQPLPAQLLPGQPLLAQPRTSPPKGSAEASRGREGEFTTRPPSRAVYAPHEFTRTPLQLLALLRSENPAAARASTRARPKDPARPAVGRGGPGKPQGPLPPPALAREPAGPPAAART
jgi:hypothetical protein